MSEDNTKELIIDVKDLSIEKEQYIDDLLRYLEEQLSQIEISRKGNSIELIVPSKMSNRVVKLRIKKFLHRKNLTEKYRPISYNTSDIKGYSIKEKKSLELSYY